MSPAPQADLTQEEFQQLMAWASDRSENSEIAARGPRIVRIKRQEELASSTTASPLSSSTSTVKPKRNSTKSATKPQDSFMDNLVEDVGRFFRVVEFLDENKCLQKFVCTVHLTAKEILPTAASFESNVLASFRMLDSFMPTDAESYRDYREAATIGINSTIPTQCSDHYDKCSYTLADIVGFNEKLDEGEKELDAEEEALAKSTPAPVKKPRSRKTKKSSFPPPPGRSMRMRSHPAMMIPFGA